MSVNTHIMTLMLHNNNPTNIAYFLILVLFLQNDGQPLNESTKQRRLVQPHHSHLLQTAPRRRQHLTTDIRDALFISVDSASD